MATHTRRRRFTVGLIGAAAVAATVIGLSVSDDAPGVSQTADAVEQPDVAETVAAAETPTAAVASVVPTTARVVPAAYSPDAGSAVLHEAPASEPKAPVARAAQVKKGDTLIAVLGRLGVAKADAFAAVHAMERVFDPRKLKIGQEVQALFTPDADEKGEQGSVLALALKISPELTIRIDRSGHNGSFDAREIRKQLQRELAYAEGTIKSSLYEAAVAANLPAEVLVSVMRPYSFDVDFQREIQPGDSFEVAYERFVDEDGRSVRYGDVVFANLTLSGKSMPIYRHEDADGQVDYFDPDGKSVRKALLQTPVDGARISSGYGMRRHPVLGYSKMHKGVDFAARRGTPIMAAGDGVVERANRFGSYGNYIRIRHNSTYKTAYAHLKGFAKGIHKGARVRQGQIIGYVGTTGRSTGPHLHYEVLAHNKQVNPKSVKLPAGRNLAGNELKTFKARVAETETQIAALRGEEESPVLASQ